jgi:hypothetical protein
MQKEWDYCELKVELVSRMPDDPANSTRQWNIDRLVKQIGKEDHASNK